MLPCKECIALAACKSKTIVHCEIVFQEFHKNREDWEAFDLDLLASYLNKSDWYISQYDRVSFYTPVEITELGKNEPTQFNIPYKMHDGRIVYLERNNSGHSNLKVIRQRW